MSRSENQFVIINGKVKEKEQAFVPACNSAVYYGTSCFESMKSESGNIFRFKDHIDRLHSGLMYIGVKKTDLPGRARVQKEINELLQVNHLQEADAKIRYQVSLLEIGGYGSQHAYEVITLASADEITANRSHISLAQVSTRVVPSASKPALYKTSNMLHYRKAFREAQEAGADDGLMLTTDGFIAETSIANIFWKKGDVVFTPSKKCDILPGIMRETIIEIIENEPSLSLKSGKFTPSVLVDADFAWTTNSVREMVFVDRIGEYKYEGGSEFIDYLNKKLAEKKRKYF